MKPEFDSDSQVLRCRVLRKCDAPPASIKDLCGRCARELAGGEDGAVEPEGTEERASCDRCGHLSSYGQRLERSRLERAKIAEQMERRRRGEEDAQLAGDLRRPRTRGGVPF